MNMSLRQSVMVLAAVFKTSGLATGPGSQLKENPCFSAASGVEGSEWNGTTFLHSSFVVILPPTQLSASGLQMSSL